MRTLLMAISTGLLGAIALALCSYLHWPAWVLFIAWVSYHLYGRSWRISIQVFFVIILGFILGFLIRCTSDWLMKSIGVIGLPIAGFFFIGALPYIARIRSLASIAAWFIGLALFFGTPQPIEPERLPGLFLPLIFGFTFAWVTDSTDRWLTRRGKAKEAKSALSFPH